ncbi:MAG: efflux RND transporter periplasmic adaptor subunit [Fimbriiglobus sp.]|nr:efflux RND transporter periplasmic adaptor subunit [Fimbriiglobus sp.]
MTVSPVAERTVRRAVPTTGTLNGFEDVTLSPKVDGQVTSVRFDVGDEVKPGDVLLELDPTDYELNMRLAENEVVVQESQVSAARAQVTQAAAPLARVKANLARVESLPAASQTEKDAARSDVALTEANVAVAKAAVTAAEATLGLKKRALAIAEQRLRDAKLRVPQAAGGSDPRYVVAARLVSVGEMTRSFPGTNAYRLVVAHTLKLKLTLPEKHTPEVKVGQPVDVRVEAFADPFPGTVARINPAVDPQTRTFQVEVTVPNQTGKLKPGGFARAEVVVGTSNAIVVPPNALVVFAGVSKVFLADGEKAREVRVEVGDRGPDWLEVRGDLKPGQSVITSGFVQVYDGCPISVRK